MRILADAAPELFASSSARVQPASPFLVALLQALTAWLADATNGITTFFAQIGNFNRVNTTELCLGTTCVTEDQLQSLLRNSAVQPAQPINPDPTAPPTNAAPSAEPTNPDPTAQPTNPEPTAQPSQSPTPPAPSSVSSSTPETREPDAGDAPSVAPAAQTDLTHSEQSPHASEELEATDTTIPVASIPAPANDNPPPVDQLAI